MDTAPAPVPPSPPTRTARQPILWTAWPRSAQLAAMFLLGLAAALLASRSFAYLRTGSQSEQQERETATPYRVDLNLAERAELMQLPGIGTTLARRIQDYRQQHGGFRSVDELREVGGIGPAKLARLRPWVYVSAEDAREPEKPPASSQPPRNTPATPASDYGAKKIAKLTGPINVNQASVEELQRLPGIGKTLSQRIVETRQKTPFQSVENLRRVAGIGPKTLERLRPHVVVDNGKAQVVRVGDEE